MAVLTPMRRTRLQHGSYIGASPGGTTEAAIKTFQAGGFDALVQQALDAAANRSAELAVQLGQ